MASSVISQASQLHSMLAPGLGASMKMSIPDLDFGDYGALRLYSNSDEVCVAPVKPAASTKAPSAKFEVSKAPAKAVADGQAPKDTSTITPFSLVNSFPTATATSKDRVPNSDYPAHEAVLQQYANLYSGGNGLTSSFSPTAAQAAVSQATLGQAITTSKFGLETSEPPKQPLSVDDDVASSGSSPASQRDTIQRHARKSASEEVLELCHRQGMAAPMSSLPMQASPVQDSAMSARNGLGAVSTAPLSAAPVMHAPEVAFVPANQSDGPGVLGPAVVYASTVSPTDRMMAHTEKPAIPSAYPSIPQPSIAQQLETANAERARLAVALKSAQNACARKDEQILDLQRRDGMLVQQYIQLQSMYQGLLDQLQREQQQWANNSAQLQGELRSKQNVEELTKLLTNQLRQEQRQKKNAMVQMQSEIAARQQAQDQLAAARAQLQQMQLSSESVQWLQSTKAKLQADLGNTNAHLQMERQRRSDATMQLQTVLTERQRMKEELDALQMQLQQQCLQNGLNGLEPNPSAARGTLGTHGSRSQLDHLGDGTPSYPQPSPFLTTLQEQQHQQAAQAQQDAAPGAQRLQYGFQDQVPDMQYGRIVASTASAGQLPGSPSGYMMRPAATMGMAMQDPVVYTTMAMQSMNPY